MPVKIKPKTEKKAKIGSEVTKFRFAETVKNSEPQTTSNGEGKRTFDKRNETPQGIVLS